MSGDVHVRLCEGVGVRLPRAPHLGCACAAQADADRFSSVLGPRREQGGLERSGAKTRLLPCRRHRQAGTTSCEFLGFEVRWGKDRKGKDHLKRRTARQKLRSALQRFTAWGKENRHHRLPALFKRLHAKLRGYSHDYGVHGNAASRHECFQQGHADFIEVAQAPPPAPQVYVARLHGSARALQSGPTTDRRTTQDETGSPHDLS